MTISLIKIDRILVEVLKDTKRNWTQGLSDSTKNQFIAFAYGQFDQEKLK